MQFGLRNCPFVFIAMMHDMKEKWEELCALNGIDPSINEGSIIIMDDTLLYAIGVHQVLNGPVPGDFTK
eukprot:scaffold28661_cov68-Attheya_sp.AAC.5